MPESDKNKADKRRDSEYTIKISFDPNHTEVTQKIDVDDEEIIDKDKQRALFASIKRKTQEKKTTNLLISKSVFTRKHITDDYIKSTSLVNVIDSIPPLEDELELQDLSYNYELKEQFEEGAQGVISTAFDKSLKRHIVVKSLKGDDSKERARKSERLFVSEARIMAQLDHPAIIPLYGLHSGTESKLHLAMKHIHGKTLQDYLLDVIDLYEYKGIEHFDERRAMATRIEYLIKICEAVDYAHCKGVLHRDLKSANIMIGNYGEVYVMDWGVACLLDPESSKDKKPEKDKKHSKRQIVGTPCYIAPEVIMGDSCSRQSDIFSLGMILFEVITLQRAVGGKTVNEILRNVINEKYCPFKHSFLKGKLPDDLKAIFQKAISHSPSHRYKTANDMAEDLKLYLMREETIARPDNILRKGVRAMINHKMISSIVILSVLLCFAGITIHSLYLKNTLVHKQKERENMLANFQYDVAQKTADMEAIFSHFKYQLANLGYITGRTLSSDTVGPVQKYDMQEYQKNPAALPDDVYSPVYGKKINLNFATLKLGPNVKLRDNISKKIVTLQPTFKHMIFRGDRAFMGKTLDEIKNIIINKGTTLSLVYIALKNGSMLSYPGGDVYVKDHDPRKLSWYKEAVSQPHMLLWSKPHRDAFSSKVVISCTRCIYSVKNGKVEFQGVAGMDISLDYIQQSMFRNKKGSGFKEYLLTKNGKVLLSSDFENKKARTHKGKTTLILKNFPFREKFINALKQKTVLFEARDNNNKYIFAFNKLPSMGYYYIQQISEEQLREDWEKRFSQKKINHPKKPKH